MALSDLCHPGGFQTEFQDGTSRREHGRGAGPRCYTTAPCMKCHLTEYPQDALGIEMRDQTRLPSGCAMMSLSWGLYLLTGNGEMTGLSYSHGGDTERVRGQPSCIHLKYTCSEHVSKPT